MRKLLDDRLIKTIDKMGDNPYEYYEFYSTPMTTLSIDEIATQPDGNTSEMTLVGEIEPYTRFNASSLDVGLKKQTNRWNTLIINFPDMIEEDFEIDFSFNLPEGITQLHYAIYFDDTGNERQYYLYNNEDGSNPSGINTTGYGHRDNKDYIIFSVNKRSPGTEESLSIKKINGIIYIKSMTL